MESNKVNGIKIKLKFFAKLKNINSFCKKIQIYLSKLNLTRSQRNLNDLNKR